MDALQPSGSSKIRGIGLACEVLAKQGAKRFVSSSGGNAGIAVAYAGRKLSVPVLVWEGNASLIDEVVAEKVPFDSVIVSVGGGGL